MTLVIFYTSAIVLGFILLFVFKKYYERRNIYYIAWFISYMILGLIAPMMNESVYYIFNFDNYIDIDPLITIFFMVFLLIPTSFLLYPIVKIFRVFYEFFERFFESIMLIFVSHQRKINYFNSLQESFEEKDNEKIESNNDL